MARQSRKETIKIVIVDIQSAVEYIHLSIASKGETYSIENQKRLANQ